VDNAETNIKTKSIMINTLNVNRFPIIVEKTLPKKFFIFNLLLLLHNMSQNKAILLLGTNLGNKKNNLEIAKTLINKEVGEIKKESNILENEAEGFTTNHLFLNQKIEITTLFSPFELLKKIKEIEEKMGRTYFQPKENEKYVDRLIDIDILFYNNLFIHCSRLRIPHPQNYSRDFIKSLSFF